MKTLLKAWNHNATNKVVLSFILLSMLTVGCASPGLAQQAKEPTAVRAETIQIPASTNTLQPPSPSPQFTATPEAAKVKTVACVPAGSVQYGKVLKIVNGTSLLVMIDNVRYVVKYIGLKAPERGEYYFPEVVRKSAQLIFAKKVALISGEIDKDLTGALPRYVLYNDVLINTELLKQGYAFLDPEFTESPCLSTFQSAQKTAQLEKIGVWGGPPTRASANLPVP